jgi:hypothetical protein
MPSKHFCLESRLLQAESARVMRLVSDECSDILRVVKASACPATISEIATALDCDASDPLGQFAVESAATTGGRYAPRNQRRIEHQAQADRT